MSGGATSSPSVTLVQALQDVERLSELVESVREHLEFALHASSPHAEGRAARVGAIADAVADLNTVESVCSAAKLQCYTASWRTDHDVESRKLAVIEIVESDLFANQLVAALGMPIRGQVIPVWELLAESTSGTLDYLNGLSVDGVRETVAFTLVEAGWSLRDVRAWIEDN